MINSYRIFVETPKEKEHVEGQGVDGNITEGIFQK
jgi:hypothetical protein